MTDTDLHLISLEAQENPKPWVILECSDWSINNWIYKDKT